MWADLPNHPTVSFFFRGKVVSGFVERVLVIADVSLIHSFKKFFRKFSELGSTSKKAFACQFVVPSHILVVSRQ